MSVETSFRSPSALSVFGRTYPRGILVQSSVLSGHIQVTALEIVGKQSRMVGHDLIAALHVLTGNHDEVSVLRKQCSKGLGVAPIDSPEKSATTLRTACSPDCS